MLQTVVSSLRVPSLPCNSTAEKAAESMQTRCLQVPGLKSFLVRVSHMSSPAEGCSVFILPGGCHCSTHDCQCSQTRGQIAATSHVLSETLPWPWGRGNRGPCAFNTLPIPPRLGLQRDLVKAEVSLWNQKQKGNGVLGVLPDAFLLPEVNMTHHRDGSELLKGVTALPVLPTHSHPLNYCLIFLPLQ